MLLRDAVEKYRRVDLSIIPVRYGDKEADSMALRAVGSINWRGRATWKPYRYRLPELRETDIWFATPQHNLGIVTGYHSLLVIDFDQVNAYELWRRKHPHIVENTAVQRSGGGFHVFLRLRKVLSPFSYHHFTLPECDNEVFGQLKGLGGFVTSWPSLHANGALYTWLDGQAPWERGILSLDSLKDIGVMLIKERRNLVPFLLRFMTNPARNVEVLRNRYDWFFRERFGKAPE